MRKLLILLVALALPSSASAGCTGEFAALAKYAGEYPEKLFQEPVISSRMRELMGPALARLETDLDVRGTVALINCELVVEGNAPHQGGARHAIVSFDLHSGTMTIGMLDNGRVTVVSSPTPLRDSSNYSHLPSHVRDWAFVAAEGFRSRGKPPPNVILALSVPMGVPQAQEQTWQVTSQDAEQLERRIILPEGSHPLASYERYYTGLVRGGRRIIRGYLYQGDKPGIYLRPSEILIADGGCSVVEVEYDVGSQRTETAYCNGVA